MDNQVEGTFSGEKPAQAGADTQVDAVTQTGTATEPVPPRVGPDAPRHP